MTGRWLRALAAAGALALFHAAAPAQPGGTCAARPSPLVAQVQQMHQVEEFRIFYTRVGPDAPAPWLDRNGDGVPDMVEDAAIQLVAARRAYMELLGFVHPLQQPRYRGKAVAIDVNVTALRSGRTGLAYDEVRRVQRASDGSQPGACALRIDLDPMWAPPNPTPAHELFHLFQNGYTMFKMSWLTEGTARWAESTLGRTTPAAVALPGSVSARQALLASSYGAAGFWAGLTSRLDANAPIAAPPWLEALRYTHGAPVWGGAPLQGAAFVRAVFEAMGRADRGVSRARGWPVHAWAESDQKSPANDAAAWAALMQVLRAAPVQDAALRDFIAFDAAHPLASP